MAAQADRKQWDRLRAAHDTALSAPQGTPEARKKAWETLALHPAPDIGAVHYKLGELFYVIDHHDVPRDATFNRLFSDVIVADMQRLMKGGEHDDASRNQ